MTATEPARIATYGKGNCRNCPYWDPAPDYCEVYQMFMKGNGYEATCTFEEPVSNYIPSGTRF